MSYLMCVDPGHANAGVAIVDPKQPFDQVIVRLAFCHTDRSDQKARYRYADDQARRSQELTRFYHNLILQYGIKRVLAELPIGGAPNSQAATDLARASTVLVAVAEVNDCAVEWYSPAEVKKAATGRANASKNEVMAAIEAAYPSVLDEFPAKGKREHVCDSLGVWLAGRNGALARL